MFSEGNYPGVTPSQGGLSATKVPVELPGVSGHLVVPIQSTELAPPMAAPARIHQMYHYCGLWDACAAAEDGGIMDF